LAPTALFGALFAVTFWLLVQSAGIRTNILWPVFSTRHDGSNKLSGVHVRQAVFKLQQLKETHKSAKTAGCGTSHFGTLPTSDQDAVFFPEFLFASTLT
jgi:hypothetical protein